MAVTLTGTGGLFTRQGRILFGIRSANSYLAAGDLSAGGLKSVGVTFTNILAEFQSTLQNIPDKAGTGLTVGRDSVRSSLAAWKNTLKTLAEQTIIEQVHADNPLPAKTVDSALRELIRQMIGAGTIYAPDNDVDASTVSAALAVVTGVTNGGNGGSVGSVLRTQDARPNELVFAEVVELECTSDINSGATARQETFSFLGEPAVANALDWNWPGGSGSTGSIVVCDSDDDGVSTALFGGNFDTFTVANKPDYWGDPLVGVYGTDILSEPTIVYRTGGKSLRFLGQTVAVLSSIAQVFGVATPAVGSSGTSFVLEPGVAYQINFYARKTAGAAAGVIQVRLLDSTNTQVTDDAGNNLLITVAVGGLSDAAWTAVNGTFVIPKTATPSTVYKLGLRVSTGVTDTESIYIDDLAMCEATTLYTNGPLCSLFAGSTNWRRGDRLNLTIANNYAGIFMQDFDRVFAMRAKGLQLPSDTGGTETLADSLVS